MLKILRGDSLSTYEARGREASIKTVRNRMKIRGGVNEQSTYAIGGLKLKRDNFAAAGRVLTKLSSLTDSVLIVDSILVLFLLRKHTEKCIKILPLQPKRQTLILRQKKETKWNNQMKMWI